MVPRRPFRWLVRSLLIVAATLAATSASVAAGGYFHVRGGGFVFNYREAKVTLTVVVMARRALPESARFEALFEDPSGSAPLRVMRTRWSRADRIGLTSPPLTGVRKGRSYEVVVRLLDPEGAPLQEERLHYRSRLDQTVLPNAPLVVGPGYVPNPEAHRSGSP